MSFEQYEGARVGPQPRYPFLTVRIFHSKAGCLGSFLNGDAEKLGLSLGGRLQLFYDAEAELIGLKSRGDDGWQSGSVKLMSSGRHKCTRKLYGLKFSLRGFANTFGLKDIEGAYRLTKQDDGMLVIDLNENLEADNE